MYFPLHIIRCVSIVCALSRIRARMRYRYTPRVCTSVLFILQGTFFQSTPTFTLCAEGVRGGGIQCVILIRLSVVQVTTQVQYRSGILTWLICCLICWITGCWCIALIPFCIDATKDVYHITPTDGKVVGVYKRL